MCNLSDSLDTGAAFMHQRLELRISKTTIARRRCAFWRVSPPAGRKASEHRLSPSLWRNNWALYCALLIFPALLRSAPAIDAMAVDQYGGIKALRGRSTGAFHLEKTGKRDSLFTPDGHGFLSLGVVHIGAIKEPSKFDLFQDQYGGDWQRVSEAAARNLKSWGFNTAGYHCPAPIRDLLPFMADAYLVKNSFFLPEAAFHYSDVFDPAVQDQQRQLIRRMCDSAKANPRLLGYYWTDTPQWDLRKARARRGTDWVSSIRQLGATAPGKQRYIEFLKERYRGNIAAINARYSFAASSFTELLDYPFNKLELSHPEIYADDQEFLRLIAREHYGVIGEETRRCDPKHLVFGERYLMGDHPDAVIQEALPYIDVLAIQPLGVEFNGALFDRLHRLAGKPILLCDHQCSFATADYPKTMWQQLESEEAVGKAYARFLEGAFAKPYILGFHRCQYIDRFVPYQGVLKQGLLRENGKPYEALANHIRDANLEQMRRFAQPQAHEGTTGDNKAPLR